MMRLATNKFVPLLHRFLQNSLKQVYPASTVALQQKASLLPTQLQCNSLFRSIFQPSSIAQEGDRGFHLKENRKIAQNTGISTLPFIIKIDLRGFKKEEITVSIKENILSIRATMKRKRGASTFYEELERHIVLPKNLDTTNIRSYWEDQGILTIEIPYATNEERTPIPVERE